MVKIKDRMASALAAGDLSNSGRDSVIATLSENLRSCNSQAHRAYLLFAGFAAAFSLVVAADVPKVSILGVDVSKANPVLLLLPGMAALFLYRASCLNELGVLIEFALEVHWRESAPTFAERNLLPLLKPPASILELEDTFDEIAGKKRLSAITLMLALFIVGLPLIWIAWSQWWIWQDGSFSWALKVVAAVPVVLCFIGAIGAIGRNWRMH